MENQPKPCETCGIEFLPPYRITREYWSRRRFCSLVCRVSGMRGERRATFNKEKVPLSERFWSKVERGAEDKCWRWIGATEGTGYGYLGGTRRQRSIKAHRYSYEHHFGAIPKGLCVCHTCDNPPCVNPAHLFLGTHAENNADRESKGRGSDKRGELNPNAKLSYTDAIEIRELRSHGLTQQSIADRFQVSQNAISQIVRGIRWKPPET